MKANCRRYRFLAEGCFVNFLRQKPSSNIKVIIIAVHYKGNYLLSYYFVTPVVLN